MNTNLPEPLPADLSMLGYQGVEKAKKDRADLLEQVFEQAGDQLDMERVSCLSGTVGTKLAVVRQMNAELNRIKEAEDTLQPHPGHIGNGGEGPFEGSFVRAIKRAGYDPTTKSRVVVDSSAALFKAVTTSGDVEDYFPSRGPGVALGADRRYLYPALRQHSLALTDTSVQYLSQTARTLASTSDMIRAVDATSTKPETALTVALASADLNQVAHKVSGVPNIVARQRQFGQLIEGDLRLGLSEALDVMVDDAITAATIPMGGAGTGIAQKIRYAAAVVEAAGYQPDTVALSPTEAVELDLILLSTNNSTGTGPLFGLRPRVSKALSLAIVFDSTAFATLHAGPVEFASFEENDGATNSMLFRAELNAVAVIDREAAACEVWAS